MNDQEKGFYDTSPRKQSQPQSSMMPPHHHPPKKLPILKFTFFGFLLGLFVVGFIVEFLAPQELKPSTYFYNWYINKVNLVNDKTKESEAGKQSLITFEVGNVQNALTEEQTDLVEKLTAKIQLSTNCQAQKIQLANQSMAECMSNEYSTSTDCQVRQWAIEDQLCPSMPVITEASRKLLANYRNRAGGNK